MVALSASVAGKGKVSAAPQLGNRVPSGGPASPPMSNPLGLELPSSFQAECEVLGACLHDPNVFSHIATEVQGDFFNDERTRSVFESMYALWSEQQGIDFTLCEEKLKEKGLLQKAGGREFLVELFGAVASANNLKAKVKILADLYGKRQQAKIGLKIYEAALNQTLNFEQSRAIAEQAMLSLHVSTKRGLQEVSAASADQFAEIEEFQQGGVICAWPSGFHALDQEMHGLHPGDLIVEMARPSVGKSALALAITDNVAQVIKKYLMNPDGSPQYWAYYYSLEMTKKQCLARLQAGRCDVEYSRITIGHFIGPNEQTRWVDASTEVAQLPILLSEDLTLNIYDIYAQCVQAARRYKPALIVIDHIGCLVQDGRNEVHELGEICKILKTLAKILNCPVLALCQLNRGSEDRSDSRPTMKDGRGSGKIEEWMDVGIGLFRADYKDPNAALHGVLEVGLLKNRHGEKDKWINLLYEPGFNRVRNETSARPFQVLYDRLPALKQVPQPVSVAC